VSDQIKRGEAMSVDDRQTSFDAMIRCTLESIAST
jgi:purine-nucleoside phosphorylase